MARIFFMAFEKANQTPLAKKLRSAGHRLAQAEPRFPEFYELLKQQQPHPEVFVVDCSMMPSHARESSNYVKSLKAYRDVPVLLYNVKKEDEAKTREKVPGARILFGDSVEKELEKLGFGPKPKVASPP